MADKSFGVKQLNLIGPSGTPTITSPNNLNVNAVTVAISTDVSIGGQVTSNVIVGTGKSVGIGSTQPQANLTVNGTIQTRQINVTGVSTFAGIATVTGTTFTNQLNVSGISTFIGNVSFPLNRTTDEKLMDITLTYDSVTGKKSWITHRDEEAPPLEKYNFL